MRYRPNQRRRFNESRYRSKRRFIRENYELTDEMIKALNDEMSEADSIDMEDFDDDNYIAALSTLPSFDANSVTRTAYQAYESVEDNERAYDKASEDASDNADGYDDAVVGTGLAVTDQIPMTMFLSSTDPATQYIIKCASLNEYSEILHYRFPVEVSYGSRRGYMEGDPDWIELGDGELIDGEIVSSGYIGFNY